MENSILGAGKVMTEGKDKRLGKEYSFSLVSISIGGSFQVARKMVMGLSNWPTETYMKGNGLMELNAGGECTLKKVQVHFIVENGKMEKGMAMEFSNSHNNNFMREPSLGQLSMVLV